MPETDLQDRRGADASERPALVDEPPAAADATARPLRGAWWPVVCVVAGIAVALVTAAGVGGLTGALRWVLPVVGVATAFVAGRRWYGSRFQPGLCLALGWLGIVVLAAVLADLLPLAEARDSSKTLDAPVLATPDVLSAHPLGTDRQGLDLLGGIVFGSRVSLIVGLGSVAIGILVGGTTGLLAGYFRRSVDTAVGIFTDATLAFPPLILLIALASALKPSVWTITLELGVVTVPVYVRLARAHTLTIAQREFVLAARAQGARSLRILRRDVAPLVVRPLLAYGFTMVAVMIVAEASLSFLGLSIPPPFPTLGNMISAAQPDFRTYPHLVFVPAAALFLTILALNQVGEAAQRRMSHRESKL